MSSSAIFFKPGQYIDLDEFLRRADYSKYKNGEIHFSFCGKATTKVWLKYVNFKYTGYSDKTFPTHV